jgi:Right handed beta helix region
MTSVLAANSILGVHSTTSDSQSTAGLTVKPAGGTAPSPVEHIVAPVVQTAPIVIVDSVSGLNAALAAALKSATPGETIELAPGQYNTVSLEHLHFSSPITITSESAANPAVLAGNLKIADDNNLNFTNLELSSVGSTDPYFAFRVTYCQDVSFSHLEVQGNLNEAPAQNVTAFGIESSSNINISDSTFNDFFVGIGANKNTNVSITDNSFTDLDKGGVEMGAVTGATISDNNFTDFHTPFGTHSDAIQLYTASMPNGSSNVVIDGNLYYRGDGTPSQGIFVQDEVGTMPYNNITIDDNTIIGAQWNAIYLKHAIGSVQVSDNTVATWTGYDGSTNGTTNFISWINLQQLSGATLTETGDSAQEYVYNDKKLTPPAASVTLGAVSDSGSALLHAWAISHPAELDLLSGSLLTLLGINQPAGNGLT